MENKRKYVGKFKTTPTKYGEIIKVSMGPRDFEMMKGETNKNGWMVFDIKKNKEGEWYGEVPQQYTPQAQPANATNDDLF